VMLAGGGIGTRGRAWTASKVLFSLAIIWNRHPKAAVSFGDSQPGLHPRMSVRMRGSMVPLNRY